MQATSDCIWITITNNNQLPNQTTVQPSEIQQAAAESDHSPPGTGTLFDSLNEGLPSGSGFKDRLVEGYSRLATERLRDGWSCYLLTFLFPQMPGQRNAVLSQMKDQLQRVYSTFITRAHRKPRTANVDDLPILIAAADLPVQKNKRASAPIIACNGGLHYHAIMLIPRASRLREPFAEHFRKYNDLYTGSGRLIQRIDIRPVVEGHPRVVDYVLKTILSGRIAYDDGLLILPRVRGEL